MISSWETQYFTMGIISDCPNKLFPILDLPLGVSMPKLSFVTKCGKIIKRSLHVHKIMPVIYVQ